MMPLMILSSRLAAVAWLLFALGLSACAAEPDVPARPESSLSASEATHMIFVTSNGWHSSIILKRNNLPPGRIPESADFPKARFLEFGWGDAEYYPAEDPTIGMALSAALLSTPSVIHVAGLAIPPSERYPKSETVSLLIKTSDLHRLVEFIDTTFDRGNQERATATGPGLYTASRFYPARGKFYLFNTCNTWSARALRTAGFVVSGSGTQTAEDLMSQVRLLGRQE